MELTGYTDYQMQIKNHQGNWTPYSTIDVSADKLEFQKEASLDACAVMKAHAIAQKYKIEKYRVVKVDVISRITTLHEQKIKE